MCLGIKILQNVLAQIKHKWENLAGNEFLQCVDEH